MNPQTIAFFKCLYPALSLIGLLIIWAAIRKFHRSPRAIGYIFLLILVTYPRAAIILVWLISIL